ncbi:Protein kinase-like domain protein [Metarhizium album ARSEF 1941]|uniref:Protein kinase-like domain protein n=1 Tax=Metarhizium album (strain ARSEF 1941) TaxID=1081103 RepID=A0A0B2WSZ1_METAS|nr:Protein kinase-like domain protein [Metarhizium album ARSEF 1941]KHN96607.1 Protein kinase-like domain protein [Metarhizium album ARSEF 1941]
MSFSNGGGTLALPSPTHAHHMDVSSAVRSLRRSISRSPSKFLSRTSSQSSDSSRQTSPQSPCRRFGATPQRQYLSPSQPQTAPPAITSTYAAPPNQSSVLTPLRPSVRLSLRSAKSAKASSTSSRPLARARASPKSPLKRALSAAPDSGNLSRPLVTSSPTSVTPRGQENKSSPRSTHSTGEKPSRHSFHLDVSGSSQYAALKALDTPTSEPYMVSTTGALKRSDATMNLDYPNQGSPASKRRSLHGVAALGPSGEFNIFGANTSSSQSFDIHEDPQACEYELTGVNNALATSTREPLSSPSPVANLPRRSSSLRKSTLQQRYGDKGSWGRRTGERQLAQMGGDHSTPVRSRPRLSTDHFLPPPVPRDSPFNAGSPLPNASIHPLDNKAQHHPHPLSKTLTTSISGNTLTEEPCGYAPGANAAEKPKPHMFSRSLPLNATRPTACSTNDHTKAVATPSQSHQLWIAAFNSTGLISKVNRNPEEEADRKLAPPDTPCKKHSNPFATFPPPVGSAMKRKGNNRNSFAGVPSTPFHPSSSRAPDTFGQPTKGLSIFQRGSASNSSRRGSILSLDGEDRRLFFDTTELPNILDGDIPPTPTKTTTLTTSLSNLSEQSLESPSANRSFTLPLSAVKPAASRESTRSPVDGRRTPQTPQESLLPLDTSRLSISQAPDNVNENAMPPPVTPTAGRDFRSSTSIFVTPVNARTSSLDIDASLYSRFDKVEKVGKGEFSTVYRVTKLEHANAFALDNTTPGNGASRSPAKDQVFAVKKSRHSYYGPKDRETKLREVRILQALTHAEHVVQYIDDWEHNFHLYIQTEFCEEGTLEKFLGNVGRDGRLDDFRIFKILQDLCLGLKEIHDAEFMHLDMKPANILITFEGVLKIGDFGLAQPCNSTEGVDVEGDREYMAPEMLKGKAGKSADVFSLGLMTLEAAANVVLPENGPTWVALRSGDLSEVPSLTWTPSLEVQRDAIGNPTESTHDDDLQGGKTRSAGNLFGSFKRSELQQPPKFMLDAYHSSSLDSIVKWMTSQEPAARPLIDQVLELEGLRWVAEHRNAPATVYEGNWGPAEMFPVSIANDSDTEMTDV